MATTTIPWPYKALLLYIEPIAALGGAILSHFDPVRYLDTMSATATYAPSNQIIYDQLAATYFLFAFNEAVVLRLTNDIRVWKGIVLGILICDLIHIYGTWSVLGTDVFIRPWLWRPQDVVNLLMLYGPGALRIAFLSGVGLQEKRKAQ